VIFPPAITIVTATIINTTPRQSLGVRISPKPVTPIIIAVTDSNAPSMAVGVDPIYYIALVVHKKDKAVGKKPEQRDFPTDTNKLAI
jgi:hypothetical protein